MTKNIRRKARRNSHFKALEEAVQSLTTNYEKSLMIIYRLNLKNKRLEERIKLLEAG